jgi:pyruvate,water dikinase
VLTTAAYDAFVAENGLQARIIALAEGVSAETPQSSHSAAEQIRDLFMRGTIADDMANAITEAYQQLGQGSSAAVAVRSSATAEDLPTASFAGQQDTFLNVRGEGALLAAIKQCWASLWTARAIAYRLRQGIAPASVSLAVVVQMLVSAESAGILFTANPINGARDQLLINATWGLGEAVVGGQVTPDTVIVDKAQHTIISRETAAKTVMTVRTAAGTAEIAVPDALQRAPALDDATAIELARFGAQIEAHYGRPMDVEWALADGAIAILQARPITALPAAPLKDVVWEPIAPKTVWMRRQIVEHMPEPLSPLFEDLYLNQGLDESIHKLMADISKLAETPFDFAKMMPHGMATTINGYAYSAASAELDWKGVFGVLRIYTRLRDFLTMPAFNWDGNVLPTYQALIARWGAVDLETATDETLLRGMAELATADSVYWWGSAANLGLSRILDSVFDLLLKSFVVRRGLPRPGLGSSAFLRGFDSKALDAQAEMEALAVEIRDSAELRVLVHNTTADHLMSALATHPHGQPVLDVIGRYLDRYGHQIYNLDFAAPTQADDPLPMLLSLKALVEQPPQQDVRTRQAQMAAERDALVEQTSRALNPLSRWLFRQAWRWTKQFAPYREHVMFYMGAAWPTVRRLAHALGQRLADDGTIAAPNDIYYLNNAEITTAIDARADGQPISDFGQVVQERRTLQASRKLLTPPPKVPVRGVVEIGPFKFKMFDPTPSGVANAGPVLNGFAVSTGRITAPASVIQKVGDFNQMQPDTILVCTTTTPAWTPLFSQAVGLVTDVGGALAHGSIVAREYGIPAVMGTGVATERIRSGMLLTVDGDAGTVTLVDEVDPQAEAERQARQAAAKQAGQRRKGLVALAAGVSLGVLWWRRRR